MRATFRNLYDQFNMAAFIRDRRTHAMSVLGTGERMVENVR